MENIEEKSNNELLFELKQLEADHEALKLKMLKDYDSLVELEKKYTNIQQLILRRLKIEI